jgi:hypothetical protein
MGDHALPGTKIQKDRIIKDLTPTPLHDGEGKNKTKALRKRGFLFFSGKPDRFRKPVRFFHAMPMAQKKYGMSQTTNDHRSDRREHEPEKHEHILENDEHYSQNDEHKTEGHEHGIENDENQSQSNAHWLENDEHKPEKHAHGLENDEH